MENLKLTQLSSLELKFDAPLCFCLNSKDNCMIFNNTYEISIFEMLYNCNSISRMPYSVKQLKASQHKPIDKIIKEVNLVKIYENATVLESQELACDIVYTSGCAIEHIKAKILQADIVTMNTERLCCVLTNYGCCEFFEKDAVIGEWKKKGFNLANILFTEVFPPMVLPVQIKTYPDLKQFVNMYLITSFAIAKNNTEMLIYLGTAAGYVVALKYNDTSCKFESYCNLKTSLLNRISYLTICNNFILVGCDQGRVVVLKINFESIQLEELEYLWSITDGMSCQKALFAYSEAMSSYLVVFCKAAHILTFCLDGNGAVKCSSTVYISGIKITGLESINETEFLITTIAGGVKHIKVSCPTGDELHCEEQSVDHDFDSSNYQILGLAVSTSKYLWSVLLFRNKDYMYRAKYLGTTALLNVCKLNSQDSFLALRNSTFENINMPQDLVLFVSLDIFNSFDIDMYMDFLCLEKLNIPHEIDDIFLQSLQIKLIIARILSKYQLMKYKKIKAHTKTELQILEPVIQLIHIFRRMYYLNELNTKNIQLSKFQLGSLWCMYSQFNQLLDNISSITSDDEAALELHEVAQKFTSYFRQKITKLNFDVSRLCQLPELCAICNNCITNFLKCPKDHDVKRCSISCTQLQLFQTKHCPHCFALARNDDAANLQELYAADERIICIYCRFLFKQDDMKFVNYLTNEEE